MSNYVKKIVSDYCVLDTETTGLSAYYDEVIEIGILKVRSGDVTDRYEQPVLLYTSPSPRDRTRSRMPSSA